MERGGAPKLGAGSPITENLKCDALLSNFQTKNMAGKGSLRVDIIASDNSRDE